MASKMEESTLYDVIVVGAGIMGSSTAYYLLKQEPSLKVLLLEQFAFLHSQGSSHGNSRIIRRSYLDRQYSSWMADCYRLWRELEAESNIKLITETGGIDLFPQCSPMKSKIECSLQDTGVQYDLLSAEAAKSRFPFLELPEGYECIYCAEAGVLNAAESTAAFQMLARMKGATLLARQKVEKVLLNGCCCSCGPTTTETAASKPVCIEVEDGAKFHCRKVVFTTGPWTNNVLKRTFTDVRGQNRLNGPALPIQVQKITLGYWKVDSAYRASLKAGKGPIFIFYGIEESEDGLALASKWHATQGGNSPSTSMNSDKSPSTSSTWYTHHLYGVPIFEVADCIKIGVHEGPTRDPDDCEQGVEEDAIALMRGAIQNCFTGVGSVKPERTERCFYSVTPDEDFVLDELPGTGGRVIVGAGFSGHGFKFAPFVGLSLAEICVGQNKPTFDLGRFSISRFS